jgi:hypothetical protein
LQAVEGANPFLATGYPKQVLIDVTAPAPTDVGPDEGGIEGSAVNLLRFGHRTIDVKDEGARSDEQILCATETQRQCRWHVAHAASP